jgi:predicted PurR-regulated permease PerM
MGVPYKGVVALFVAFADLIPLVGATLGAIVAIAVAALHSLPAPASAVARISPSRPQAPTKPAPWVGR